MIAVDLVAGAAKLTVLEERLFTEGRVHAVLAAATLKATSDERTSAMSVSSGEAPQGGCKRADRLVGCPRSL